MADVLKVSLQDGTLVRHKNSGYEGRIEGTTQIKACFTRGGASLPVTLAKEMFQYRVVITGQTTRHIAPAEDLEILEQAEDVVCFRCHFGFRSKPGLFDRASGRCTCGAWICPACLACQRENAESADGKPLPCSKERKRLVAKLANKKGRGSTAAAK
jgi:hypothetical protein